MTWPECLPSKISSHDMEMTLHYSQMDSLLGIKEIKLHVTHANIQTVHSILSYIINVKYLKNIQYCLENNESWNLI